MKLSIIIVHYRTPELLKLCLKRLGKYLGNIEHEIKIIDNSNNNIGFARGVNIGLCQTTGEYRLILNPDALITEGAVQKMLAYMDKHKDIGMIGPQLKYFNNEHQRSYHRFYRPITIIARRTFLGKMLKGILDKFLMNDTDPNRIQTPDWILGAAMLVRSSAIDKVGLMDERFFLYFEDVDWCRRFWHNGYKLIYFPDAVFYHYYPRLSTAFNRTALWHITSAVKYFWKYRNLQNLSSASSSLR